MSERSWWSICASSEDADVEVRIVLSPVEESGPTGADGRRRREAVLVVTLLRPHGSGR